MKTYKSKDYYKYGVIVLAIFALLAGNIPLARFLVRAGLFEEVEH